MSSVCFRTRARRATGQEIMRRHIRHQKRQQREAARKPKMVQTVNATVGQLRILAKTEGWDDRGGWRANFVYGDDLRRTIVAKARKELAAKFDQFDVSNFVEEL